MKLFDPDTAKLRETSQVCGLLGNITACRLLIAIANGYSKFKDLKSLVGLSANYITYTLQLLRLNKLVEHVDHNPHKGHSLTDRGRAWYDGLLKAQAGIT